VAVTELLRTAFRKSPPGKTVSKYELGMNSNPFTYCVIGFGIAGQLVVLELLSRGISQSSIVICDSTFLGGDLLQNYSCVLSNTPWWKTRKALEAYPKWSDDILKEADKVFETSKCMPVGEIAALCRAVAMKASESVEKCRTTVKSFIWTDPFWTITHTTGTIKATNILLAQGGVPKELDLSIPSIPLNLALDKAFLERALRKSEKVVVFGTAHSGTLILQNLNELDIQTVSVYRGDTPFRFERDKVYDGVKENSETIADAILNGEHKNLTLVRWSQPLELHKALLKASYVIYAIGFESRKFEGIDSSYDPATSKLSAGPNLYGYGLAYPGVSVVDGKTYMDVSVLSFQAQIQRCLPALL
jgi:pyruvate/2-oxoglutarate dehydrogenase complex dihydrolipoamide dehydrogenase (E3) component